MRIPILIFEKNLFYFWLDGIKFSYEIAVMAHDRSLPVRVASAVMLGFLLQIRVDAGQQQDLWLLFTLILFSTHHFSV